MLSDVSQVITVTLDAISGPGSLLWLKARMDVICTHAPKTEKCHRSLGALRLRSRLGDTCAAQTQ